MRIEMSVDIDRPADMVWPVLVDLERWPDWTASMISIERLDQSVFGFGSRVRIRQPGLKAMVWQVSEFQRGRLFTWETRSVGVFVIARHVVTPNGQDRCTVTLTIAQKGWLASLLRPFIETRARRYVEMEAQGLKRRCEMWTDTGSAYSSRSLDSAQTR